MPDRKVKEAGNNGQEQWSVIQNFFSSLCLEFLLFLLASVSFSWLRPLSMSNLLLKQLFGYIPNTVGYILRG